jgi:hypothetical protein
MMLRLVLVKISVAAGVGFPDVLPLHHRSKRGPAAIRTWSTDVIKLPAAIDHPN